MQKKSCDKRIFLAYIAGIISGIPVFLKEPPLPQGILGLRAVLIITGFAMLIVIYCLEVKHE